MAGILSKGIKLSYSATASSSHYTEVANLQQIPDIGGDAEQVDVTCLGDANYKYIPGLKNFGNLDFTFLFDSTVYSTLSGFEGTSKAWKLEIPTGDSSTLSFTFNAIPYVKINSVGVNAPIQFTLSLALQSDITVA